MLGGKKGGEGGGGGKVGQNAGTVTPGHGNRRGIGETSRVKNVKLVLRTGRSIKTGWGEEGGTGKIGDLGNERVSPVN